MLAPGRFVWADEGLVTAPIRVTISLAEQKAYVFRGSALVAIASVSMGRADRSTPTDIFSIREHWEVHRCNLYDDAAMSYMQRLTWDGIAIHAGRDPGFPASHGCIRVPTDFARKLFAAASLATTVTATNIPVDPAAPYIDAPLATCLATDDPILPDPVIE